METMQCEICATAMQPFETGTILQKYTIQYFHCSHCGFVRTEEPYWLDEAYSDAIVDSDIGLIGRNITLSRKVAAILSVCLPHCKSFLDYGGGYGMFVRLMRDAGFDFEWFDKYCDNLFAKQFVREKKHYDLVTAFELFEHFPNPMEEIGGLISIGDNVLFSTVLVPKPTPKISDWWYYAPHGGQHISFYTANSLEYLAKSFERHYVGNRDIHLFSKQPISPWKFSFAIRFASLITRFKRRESLLPADYKLITGMDL